MSKQQPEPVWVDVVGESHYQGNLERICGPRTTQSVSREVTARLVAEPNNPYDKNAVIVLIGGLPVGHLSRETAAQLRPRLPKTGLDVPAEIRGGWQSRSGERGLYGVQVGLPAGKAAGGRAWWKVGCAAAAALFVLAAAVSALLDPTEPAEPAQQGAEPARATVAAVPTFTSTPQTAQTGAEAAEGVSTSVPTAAPIEATPSGAVQATEAAGFERWTPEQALDAFRAAGLEVGEARELGREDYGMAPLLATRGLRFTVPSLGADAGGRVFTFANEADRDAMRAYYAELGRSSAAFYSHTMARGNLLVQINGAMADEQAAQYRAALDAMQ